MSISSVLVPRVRIESRGGLLFVRREEREQILAHKVAAVTERLCGVLERVQNLRASSTPVFERVIAHASVEIKEEIIPVLTCVVQEPLHPSLRQACLNQALLVDRYFKDYRIYDCEAAGELLLIVGMLGSVSVAGRMIEEAKAEGLWKTVFVCYRLKRAQYSCCVDEVFDVFERYKQRFNPSGEDESSLHVVSTLCMRVCGHLKVPPRQLRFCIDWFPNALRAEELFFHYVSARTRENAEAGAPPLTPP